MPAGLDLNSARSELNGDIGIFAQERRGQADNLEVGCGYPQVLQED